MLLWAEYKIKNMLVSGDKKMVLFTLQIHTKGKKKQILEDCYLAMSKSQAKE